MELIKEIGAFAGLAAFFGLALLALLSFTQGRDIRRLREWAGSAPERDVERKETTSTAAAQRAEELRRLEESRTAELEAVALREQRRQRREGGHPELTRGERLRAWSSRKGARLAEPRYLAAVFVAVLILGGGVIYGAVHGFGGAGGKAAKSGKDAAAIAKPSEIEVAVLNGTAVPGLAARYGDKVQRKGFKLGAVTNERLELRRQCGHVQGRPCPWKNPSCWQGVGGTRVQPMSSAIGSVSSGAPVSVVVGEDNAPSTG